MQIRNNRGGFIGEINTIGEFALDGTERIEARDVKLAAALNLQFRGGGWKKITLPQAITMLVGVSRPVCNAVQDVPISNA